MISAGLIVLIIHFYVADIHACNVSSDRNPVTRPFYGSIYNVILKYDDKNKTP
jgi:hypothetical protein